MNTDPQVGIRFSRSKWWPRLPFALLLILCGSWAYRPALNRVFAEDQIPYFAELDGETSLAAGLRLLDYSVVRQYARGDEALYRPLLFTAMAMQNAAFGRDFQAWNMASLILHLLVAYLLFEMLWHMQRSLLACGIALLFAMLASNVEQVSWNHIGGYLLAFGLLLAALWAAREMVQENGGVGASIRWAWVYAFTLLGAMLSHEIAVFAGLGVVIHGVGCCWRKPATRWRRLALAWGAPILIYAVLYSFHLVRCERFFWADPPVVSDPSSTSWAMQWPLLLWRWGVRILLPDQCQMGAMPFSRSMWVSQAGWQGMKSLPAAALWLGLLICLRRGLTRRHLKEAWPFGALLAFLIVSYAGMNLVGRPHAQYVTYYLYLPALLGAALLYSLIDFSRVGRGERACALAILLLLAMAHGGQTYQTNCQIREVNRPAERYYRWIEQAMRPHLGDEHFTFAIQGAPPELDPGWPLFRGYPDSGVSETKSISEWLYGKRHDAVAPTETWVFPGLDSFPR